MTANTVTTKNESQATRIDRPGRVIDLTLTESTFGVMTFPGVLDTGSRRHNGLKTSAYAMGYATEIPTGRARHAVPLRGNAFRSRSRLSPELRV